MEVFCPGVVHQDTDVIAAWCSVGAGLIELSSDRDTVALDRPNEEIERITNACATGRLVATIVLRSEDEHQVRDGRHDLELVVRVVAEDINDVFHVSKPLRIHWEIHGVAECSVHCARPSIILPCRVPFAVVVDALLFADADNAVGHVWREGVFQCWLSARWIEIAGVDVARRQPSWCGAGRR